MSNIGCDFDDEGYASPDPVFCLGDTPLPIDRYFQYLTYVLFSGSRYSWMTVLAASCSDSGYVPRDIVVVLVLWDYGRRGYYPLSGLVMLNSAHKSFGGRILLGHPERSYVFTVYVLQCC